MQKIVNAQTGEETTDDTFVSENLELTDEQQSKLVRSTRDALLKNTDWVVIKAAESGATPSQPWVDYRQSLRDVPQQAGFPHDVIWPTPPE